MKAGFHRLRLLWLALLGLGWTTTLSFGAVVVQSSTIDAVTNGYDMAGAFNQSYDETPRPVWNENQPEMADEGTFFGSTAQFNAAKTTPPTVDRIRQVAQQGYDYAVQNPRVPGLNRMGLGKDAEIQATRWTRRWAERYGVDLGPGGLQFQVRGANSVPDMVYNPATQTFDFKLTPKAFKPAQHRNFQSDFPGYGIDYIYGP